MGAEPTTAIPPPDLPSLCLAITEHAPLPMVTLEGATRIVRYANPAFCRMMGLSPEAIVGKPFDELLPEKDNCVSLIDRVFRTKKPASFTEQEPDKPHPVFWSYTIWPLKEIDGLVGVMIQVTETADVHGKTVAMNEALVLGSIRQHELTEAAEKLNVQLLEEVATRGRIAAELSQKARELAEKARLLDLSHDAIIVRDMEGHVRYWNHGAEELYGWSREEALGKISHLLLQTEFPIPLEQMTEELHRTDRWIGELVHTARDGRRLTVLARKTLDRDSEGHPAAVLENITDITARKRAETALRESEERLRLAIAGSDLGTWHWDLRTGALDWSERCLKIFGIPPRTAMSYEKFVGALHPEDRARADEAVRRAIRDGSEYRIEFRNVWPDASVHWAVSLGRAYYDAAGVPTRMEGIAFDITERKRAEQTLAERTELLDGVLEGTTDVIFVKDLKGRCLMANAAFAAAARSTPELLVGKTDEDWFPPDVAAAVRQQDEAVIAGGSPVQFEETIPVAGEARSFLTLKAPLRDGSSRVIGILGIGRDITERRRLEDALVARAEDLARADRSKDEFLAMLAHELRNPLAPLRSAAEILQTDGASPEACALAQGILTRQIENMSRMIEDLLDVSRITEGKIALRPQVVALADVVNAAASLARPGMEARGQELKITLPAEPVFLHADATRLEQVFGNLLTNASKYSGSGCHIAVTAEVVPDESHPSHEAMGRMGPMGPIPLDQPRQVIVRVRDDGIGIAPELLPRIFDLFVQATRSLDRASGGLGIGLTLVQRLVKLHGGSVEARSAGLDQGSEFIVRLPILTTTAAPAPPPAAPAHDLPRRILIVDDNEDSARSMATLQGLRGHATRTAFTGPDAVAAAAEFAPDVVLLDIGLPGMDGYEVARQLRAMPAMAGAFLVAVSGYGSAEDRARARLAGFDEYLVKPADHNLLRTWLRSRG